MYTLYNTTYTYQQQYIIFSVKQNTCVCVWRMCTYVVYPSIHACHNNKFLEKALRYNIIQKKIPFLCSRIPYNRQNINQVDYATTLFSNKTYKIAPIYLSAETIIYNSAALRAYMVTDTTEYIFQPQYEYMQYKRLLRENPVA